VIARSTWFARAADSVGTRRFARRLALAFFIGWLVILVAGADFPPPAGFVLLVVLDALAAGCVYYRVPYYLHWQSVAWPRRLPAVLLDGAAVGFLFALLPVAVQIGEGEPSLAPTRVDLLIWFGLVTTVGIANSMLVYLCTAVYRRVTGHPDSERSSQSS
jgi:hypothetical protein